MGDLTKKDGFAIAAAVVIAIIIMFMVPFLLLLGFIMMAAHDNSQFLNNEKFKNRFNLHKLYH